MATTPGDKGEHRDAAEDFDLGEALDKLAPEQLAKLEFVINGDGSVTFIDFPPELMDIAYALNPDDPLVCERRALAPETKPTKPEPDS